MDFETKILDIIGNGILILNKDHKILFWNKWLTTHTRVSKETAEGNTLYNLFAKTSFSLLERKIKIAFKLQSSTFMNSNISKYVIPIEQKKITKSIFRHMRQDVVITPLSEERVSIIIYDSSSLLEAKSIIDEQLIIVERQAITDSLTQSYNRNKFNQLLLAEIKKANRHDLIFSIIIFDIDDFKSVNDTWGHLEGDKVLKEMAGIAMESLRESDIFARWGGEEFSILLPGTGVNGAAVAAEKLRQQIETFDFGKSGRNTCSFGVAEYFKGAADNIILTKADQALYHAKSKGKNQVAVFVNDLISTWKGE